MEIHSEVFLAFEYKLLLLSFLPMHCLIHSTVLPALLWVCCFKEQKEHEKMLSQHTCDKICTLDAALLKTGESLRFVPWERQLCNHCWRCLLD